MKLCMVYRPDDRKINGSAYCSVFKGMFDAVIDRFETGVTVTRDCSAQDIDADVIFFFDVHSSHHITIDGIDKHPAVKMEYWNDPHQEEIHGQYIGTNETIHKLGAEQRCRRAQERGIDNIVSPVKYAFYESFWKYLGSDAEKMLLHFPPAPSFESISTPLNKRKHAVLANGATWGDNKNKGYEFRSWAYGQPYVTAITHCVRDDKTPSGENYHNLLSQFSAALALCTPFPVVKYFEIPLAGCLCFAEYHKEYEELGFREMESCIYVDKHNFKKRINEFLNAPEAKHFQDVATQGRMLMEQRYTARHFADFVYEHVKRIKQ